MIITVDRPDTAENRAFICGLINEMHILNDDFDVKRDVKISGQKMRVDMPKRFYLDFVVGLGIDHELDELKGFSGKLILSDVSKLDQEIAPVFRDEIRYSYTVDENGVKVFSSVVKTYRESFVNVPEFSSPENEETSPTETGNMILTYEWIEKPTVHRCLNKDELMKFIELFGE